MHEAKQDINLYHNRSIDPGTREHITAGLHVAIVLKKDQPTGTLTYGVVQEILTSAPYHHRGIKVRLTTGQVGRVQAVYTRTSA